GYQAGQRDAGLWPVAGRRRAARAGRLAGDAAMSAPGEGAALSASHPLPNALPRPPDELGRLRAAWERPRGWRVLGEVNNNLIGPLFVATGLLFLTLAGLLGVLMRAQLAMPGLTIVDAATYNQVFTMH